MPKVVSALFGAQSRHERADTAAEFGYGPLSGFAQECLELAEGHLDRIEVGRVLGQVLQGRASGFDCLSHARSLMSPQIIQHHDISAPERGSQHFVDVGQEYLAGHRSIYCHRRNHAIMA